MFGKAIIYAVISSVVLLSIALGSCKKDGKQRSGADSGIENKENKANLDLIVQLPMKIDSSAYILFPVGKSENYRNIDKFSYSKNGHYFYVENLVFQHAKTMETRLLSKNKIQIISYEQLHDENNNPEKLMIYQVIDHPSNDKSKELDIALYVGSLDGKIFKKISLENHKLHNWKYLSATSKIYYHTSEDTNQDGVFDSDDKQHLYYLSVPDLTSHELIFDELK